VFADTEDGGIAFSGQLYGEMAERFRTGLLAFATPDDADQPRTPQQRNADALDQLFSVALGAGEAPTRHGVRPHVLVLVEASQLARDAGFAELGLTGPVTMAEVRSLLRDCTFSRVILGPDSVPIEVSEAVRTVPAGLWRALVARDNGCSWAGCDAPPFWCDVAHAGQPFAHGGKLSLDNATLLCRRHHRRFDAGGWTITIEGATLTFTRTSDGGGGKGFAVQDTSRGPKSKGPPAGPRAGLSTGPDRRS
jgi:hypothetical protein